MARRITALKPGLEINYLSEKYTVQEVYTYMAYLRHNTTGQVICVDVGDLVVAGIEPSFPMSMPISYEQFSFATHKVVKAVN